MPRKKFPRKSNNILVTGGAFTVIEGNQYVDARSTAEGMKILYDHACPGALHDSVERLNPPKCHPKTREAVQNAILDWVDDEESEFTAMWMKGAMGAGKTAIAQTIALILQAQGQLSSSFFFGRTSSGRNNHTRLIATLAYQMSEELPATRPLISATVSENHLMFKKSLQTQLETLIIDTLSDISPPSDRKPRLIIIDGLDECNDSEVQSHIVKVLISTLVHMKHRLLIPHKILIVSRPEMHLEVAFCDGAINPFVRQVRLDASWKPDSDIRRFLLDSFEDIKRIHNLLGRHIPNQWPPPPDINTLVHKSSGQFIYAAVVIKFLKSPRYNPIHSLRIILGLVQNLGRQPYEELDALYAHIFSVVNNLDLVLRILCVRTTYIEGYVPIESSALMEVLLDIPDGVESAMNDLASIITTTATDDSITFLHASLPEYLSDKSRSGPYHIYSDIVCEHVVSRCVHLMNQEIHFPDLFETGRVQSLIQAVTKRSTVHGQREIYRNISNMDVMHHYQSVVYPNNDANSVGWAGLYVAWGDFIMWIIATYKSLGSTIPGNPLTPAFKNIQDWITGKLKTLPFSGSDNENGWDIWIFAVYAPGPGSWNPRRSEFLNEISKVIVLIIGHTIAPSDALAIANSIISSIEPVWGLLSYLTKDNEGIFHDAGLDILARLLPDYSFLGERCLNAALRFFQDLIYSKKLEWLEHYFSIEYMIFDILKWANADRSLCALLRTIMVDDASDRGTDTDRKDALPQGARQVFKTLPQGARRVFKYLQRHRPFGGDDMACYRYFVLARSCNDYVKRTHLMFPDLDKYSPEETEENNRPRASKKRRSSLDLTLAGHSGPKKTHKRRHVDPMLDRITGVKEVAGNLPSMSSRGV